MPGLPESENQRRETPVLSMPEITPDLTLAMNKAGFQMLRRSDLPSVEEPLSRLHPVIRADEIMDYFLTTGEQVEAQNFGGWLYFQKEDPRTRLNTITRVGYIPVHPQNALWSAVWGLQMDTMLDLDPYATILNPDSARSLVPSQEALDQVLHEGPPKMRLISRQDLKNHDGRSPIYMDGKLFYSNYLMVSEPYPFSNNEEVMQTVAEVITESVPYQEQFIKRGLSKVIIDQANPDTLVMTILGNFLGEPIKVKGGRVNLSKPRIEQALQQHLAEHPGQPVVISQLARNLELSFTTVRKEYERIASEHEVPPLGKQGKPKKRYDALILEYQETEEENVSVLEQFKNLPRMLIENRIILGLTQNELAKRLGMAGQQIQRHEAGGYRSMSFRHLLNLVEVLQPENPGRSIYELMEGELNITNKHQYLIARVNLKNLRGSSQDEEAQIRIKQLEQSIALYENLSSGRMQAMDLADFKKVPEILIAKRIALGLSQKDLGTKLGISAQQLQRYEATGYNSASFKRLMQVIDVLKPENQERPRISVQQLSYQPRNIAETTLARILDEHLAEDPNSTVTSKGLREEFNQKLGINVSPTSINQLYHKIALFKKVPPFNRFAEANRRALGLQTQRNEKEARLIERQEQLAVLKDQYLHEFGEKREKRTKAENESFKKYLIQMKQDTRNWTYREIAEITGDTRGNVKEHFMSLTEEERMTSKR
ncbi:MAG: helix-turn-helix domain-containing protein [Candidatus Daviesbacteria bacterium]|nr:helix-turn-helix domain-containing protein [Candidatus Daviesbacteria bacterium]